jgi:anti-anti-sigma regulatory factor
MKITTTISEKTIPVTIVHLEGALDGSNFECLIDKAQKLYAAKVRDLILDLGKLTFISSAGLGALHQVGLLFRGKKPVEKKDESWSDYRWAAFHATENDHTPTPHEHVKLLSPTREVMEVLDMIGFNSLFAIFTDLEQAITSFHQSAPVMEASLQ